MTLDAVIAKINDNNEDKIFLFFLDPENDIIKDGLNISDDEKIYEKLDYDTLIVCEVKLKDGTKDTKIDLDDFIDGQYGRYDIFIHIKDLGSYKLGEKEGENINSKTIKKVIYDGEFEDIAKKCIMSTKNEINKEEKKDE